MSAPSLHRESTNSLIVSRKTLPTLPPVMRCVFEGQMAPLLLLVAAGADLAARDSENSLPSDVYILFHL